MSIIRKQLGTKGITILAIAALLVVLGAIFPSKKVVEFLAIGSSYNLKDLVAGLLLFKIGLVVDGLVLTGIWVFYSQSVDGVSKGALPLLNMSEGQCAGGRKSISRWLPLTGVLIVAALLRVKGLDSGLWYDEVMTLVEFVRLPLHQLLFQYSDQNNHPLFSLLGHLSVWSFGESAWALRLPALLFGLASVWALFRLGQALTDERESLLSIILLSVSYQHVWFSQNARGYTGLLFWGLLATLLFLKGLQRPSLGQSVGYAVCMALGMYTHLTAGFTFASHVLIYGFILLRQNHSLRPSSRSQWWPIVSFFLATCLTLQLYALILPQVFSSFRVQVGGARVETWTSPIWAIAETIRGLQLGFGTATGGLAALLIFFAGLISYYRKNPIVLALLIIPILLGAVPLLLLHRHFYPRFFFPLLGLGTLVLVRGTSVIGGFCASLLSRGSRTGPQGAKLGTILFSAIIVISFLSLPVLYRYPKQDYIGARSYVEEHLHAGDDVVTVGLASYPYQRYYLTKWKNVKTLAELNAVRSNSDTTWLLYTFPAHMRSFHPDLMSVILKEFTVVKEFPGTVGDGTIYVCRTEPTSVKVSARRSEWTIPHQLKK